jgi:hypothetical protein
VIEKQISKAEEELYETGINDNNEVWDEEGGDVMEITEELDEDGNITSSRVENFDERVDEMQKTLEARAEAKTPNLPLRSKTQPIAATPAKINDKDDDTDDDESDSLEHHPIIVPPQSSQPFASTGSYSEAYENMSEIKPIVATMDVEEYSSEDHDSDMSENEYGMNDPGYEISQDYVQQMEALIKKHTMSNAGKENVDSEIKTAPTSAEIKVVPIPADIKVAPTPGKAKTMPKSSLANGKSNEKVKQKERRGVKFAEALDIAPKASNLTEMASTIESAQQPAAATLSDFVVERSPTHAAPPITTENQKPSSRFKAARQNHTTSSPAVKHVSDELSFKEELTLYKKRMDEPEQRLDPGIFRDRESEVKNLPPTAKMSKFKAARLGIRQDD